MIQKTIQEIDIASVSPFPGNPQEVTQEKMKMMTSYMRKHGWVGQMPLIWLNREESRMYWISGHHRAIAAIQAGITRRSCEVIIDPEYGWEQAKKDLLMYNNVHGDPDKGLEKDIIADLMSEFGNSQDSLTDEIGRSAKEIDKILGDAEPKDISDSIGSVYEVVVTCSNETNQKELFERLQSEGYECRVSIL